MVFESVFDIHDFFDGFHIFGAALGKLDRIRAAVENAAADPRFNFFDGGA